MLKNGLKHTLKPYGYKRKIQRNTCTTINSTSNYLYLCEILGLSIEYFYFMPSDPSYLPGHLARPSPKGRISEKTAILCNLLSFYVTIDIFEVIESEKILLNYKNIIPLDLEKKCCLNISQNLGTKLRVN